MSASYRTVSNAWHKGSRYWRYGTLLVLVVQTIGVGVIIWRATFTGEALTMIGTVTAAFVVGAGAKSTVDQYRRPEAQQPYPPEEK